MNDKTMCDCRILVAEDEFMLADDLHAELVEAGAIVLGPAGTLEAVLALLQSGGPIDGAILDVNLGGQMIYPVADLCIERNVKVVFTTGYDASAIPVRFSHIVRCGKPVDMRKVTQAIGKAIHPV